MLDKEEGFEEGSKCNRDGCEGVIHFGYEGEHGHSSCTCFQSAPCSHCTSIYCDTCDYSESF